MGAQSRADLVVIGAGIAGLTAALSASAAGLRVVVLNKGPAWVAERAEQPTSTFYAQGGIAVVEPDNPDDSINLHVSDTLAAGAGLTHAAATRPIVTDGWPAITELVERGATFDRNADGRFLRTREGGHSVRRIIHAGGDATGAQVQRALGQAVTNSAGPNLVCIDDAAVTDLIKHDGVVVGAAYRTPDAGEAVIYAPTILLATGGAGHLYAATTNPGGATADGIALALRAGAKVADLEFIQFHPTMLYLDGARGRRTLISEAVRGEGGRLVDADGKSVTAGVHPMGDLAPRDVVARAVEAAMDRTGQPCVYLDVSGVDDFARRFPTVTAGLRAAGLATETTTPDLIPVVPGAHYLCGGVVATPAGETSVPGLLVAGEVSRTGLHGANRLASNSLLEGLVMGRKASAVAAERRGLSVEEALLSVPTSRPAMDRKALQDLMSDEVALQRSATGLDAVARRLGAAPTRAMKSVADLEDAALTLTARAVVAAARAREESRGCHARVDFPDTATEATSRAFVLVNGDIVAVAD